MASKYKHFDRKLFAWLRDTGEDITTAGAIEALQATNNRTQQRHISRRFTQLEDKGVLSCSLKGTTRVCTVVADVPDSLSKEPWRPSAPGSLVAPELPSIPSIPAADSEEFVRNGGVIQQLPCRFDTPAIGAQPYGPSFFDDGFDDI